MFKSKVTADMLDVVSDMLGSSDIAAQLVPVFEENMEEFDEENFTSMKDSMHNYLFFVWFMGFACGLENAEQIQLHNKLINVPTGSLQ